MEDVGNLMKWVVENQELIVAFVAVLAAAAAAVAKLRRELAGAGEALSIVGAAIEDAGAGSRLEQRRAAKEIKQKVALESEARPRVRRRIELMVEKLSERKEVSDGRG